MFLTPSFGHCAIFRCKLCKKNSHQRAQSVRGETRERMPKFALGIIDFADLIIDLIVKEPSNDIFLRICTLAEELTLEGNTGE